MKKKENIGNRIYKFIVNKRKKERKKERKERSLLKGLIYR